MDWFTCLYDQLTETQGNTLPAGICTILTLTEIISSDITKFNVLYNSDLRSHERLYAALDVDLCRVRLHEPLEVIVQNPLLYVRDLVPKPCFDALAKLDQVGFWKICLTKKPLSIRRLCFTGQSSAN